jgi:hypothetical protein
MNSFGDKDLVTKKPSFFTTSQTIQNAQKLFSLKKGVSRQQQQMKKPEAQVSRQRESKSNKGTLKVKKSADKPTMMNVGKSGRKMSALKSKFLNFVSKPVASNFGRPNPTIEQLAEREAENYTMEDLLNNPEVIKELTAVRAESQNELISESDSLVECLTDIRQD